MIDNQRFAHGCRRSVGLLEARDVVRMRLGLRFFLLPSGAAEIVNGLEQAAKMSRGNVENMPAIRKLTGTQTSHIPKFANAHWYDVTV